MTIFSVSNLSCTRGQKLLFANVSFQLAAGELLVIEGANGSGKSSLLRMLTGLATPNGGEIFWHKTPIEKIEFQNHLHYLAHSNGLKLGLTVIENLQLNAALNLSAPRSNDIEELLVALQLQQDKNTFVKFLSAGQKRRVALAILVLAQKNLWLLDEPFTALDAETCSWFSKQLEKHLQQGGRVILSSHQALSLQQSTKVKTLRLPC